ncbi:MAG: hypothetical protein WDW38_009448 [Sanguina aurantia]
MSHPTDVNSLLDLAMACQQLNYLKPDGGTRVQEGVAAYRSALALMPASELTVRVHSNLAALLLEAGRLEEALQELDRGAEEPARTQTLPSSRRPTRLTAAQATRVEVPVTTMADMAFNRAKTLATGGKLQLADETYMATAGMSYGAHLGAYTKAVAAARSLPDDIVTQALQVHRDALALAHPRLTVGHTQVHVELKRLGHSVLLLPTRSDASGSGGPVGDDESSSAGGSDVGSGSSGSGSDLDPAEGGGGSGAGLEWLVDASAQDIAYLGFALYKALDKRDMFDAAWQHLASANALIRPTVAYSVESERQQLRILTNAFARPLGGSGSFDRTPIFVVGLPRSGSTLVEQIYASHSAVWAAGEDTAMAPLTSSVNERLGQADFELVSELRGFGQRYVSEMRAKLPEARAGYGNVTRIVDKMLRNLWLVGYIQMLLPLSCVVHVVRHPLDAGMSCYSQPFGYQGVPWSWDLQEVAAQVNMTYEMADHWDKVLPGRILTIYYEELVSHFPAVASDLLAHCGLGWEGSVLDFHKVDRAVASASVAQVREPLYSSSVGRWKKYSEHLKPLKDALGGSIAVYEGRLAQALARRVAAAEAAAAEAKDEL